MELSRQVHDAGREIVSAKSADVSSALNGILNRFLGWPFRAVTGYCTDRDANRTATFGSAIWATSHAKIPAEPVAIPADALAVVMDVSETIDLETFRGAYHRVASAKALKKASLPQLSGVAQTTTTLGIIFAANAALPLERLAQELDQLNQTTPCPQWPDMVAVLSTGVINYGVQFPSEQVSGDWLPPEQGATAAHTIPAYVIMLVRPTGPQTFNKLLAFLLAHLAIFSPGAKVPNFAHVLKGVPDIAMTICGYQYTLKGELLPVPRQFYNDRYLPPPPLRIENANGELLSTIQFLPRQDGVACPPFSLHS